MWVLLSPLDSVINTLTKAAYGREGLFWLSLPCLSPLWCLRHSSRSMSEPVMLHSYSRSSGQQMAVVSLQSKIPATECLPIGAGSSYINECNQDNLPQACPKAHLPDVSRPIILTLNTTSEKSSVSTGRVGRPILSKQSSSSLKQIANSLRTCKKVSFELCGLTCEPSNCS